MRRRFVTPEGVDLSLELGSAGERASAFLIDTVLILIILIGMSFLLALTLFGSLTHWSGVGIVWLLGAFLLRNFWFTLFEMGRRGATPGKRLSGLRVVARDGARLTGGAVLVRNAMREIELFLPLSFLGARVGDSAADAFLSIFALAWTGIFLLFPLFNRDRLRVGDLLAGTWVVHSERSMILADLEQVTDSRQRRNFTPAALALYGVYELQTLEDLLRRGDWEALSIVAETIQQKAGIPRDYNVEGFLSDYYAALCERLEKDLMIGRRRADKNTLAS